MEKNFEENNHDKKIFKIERPTSFNLATQPTPMMVTESPTFIDLCTPIMDIDDIPVVQQSELISNTVVERFPKLQHRLPILPLYPTNNIQDENHPLMANIPPYLLTQTEISRRCSNVYKPAFDIMDNDSTIPSFLREKYEMFYVDLIERLKVDMTILDFNYTRLNKFMTIIKDERIQLFNLRSYEIQPIDEKEYLLALEFFLQFDINMFYMKTCSFRFARPRSLNEGLFCLQEPEARYELAACGNCALCYPQYGMKYRSKKFVVEFSQGHKHTFINGYETILNCSASCHTRNIIYALTCPCGNVDYIGETMQSLHDRLRQHRQHGNRIIHEFLVGQENILSQLLRGKSEETKTKDRMKLYQHSTRCPIAMQIFLDANPQYWRFVPMTLSKEDTMTCIEVVPRPPSGYTFSNRQIVLQSQYFHKKRDKNLPDENIDLYNATIVAVLPEYCSDMFRYTSESLFISYDETNLNTIGNVLNQDQSGNYYPLNNPWLIRGDAWCQGLVRRPQPQL